jgi:hypothetical protein
MSQPGLPVNLSTVSPSDDASALPDTTALEAPLDPEWLSPNSDIGELYELEKQQRKKSHVWNFFLPGQRAESWF